jgi:hypothetical protein
MRLHLKVLCEPTGVSREQMVESMQQTYSAAGIGVHAAARSEFPVPEWNELEHAVDSVLEGADRVLGVG